MVKKSVLSVVAALSALFSVSCQYDYDISGDVDDFAPRVVVNSLLTPDKPFSATLCWSGRVGDEAEYRAVDDFTLKLYENETLVGTFPGTDGYVKSNLKIKEGTTYRFEAEVSGYGKLSAETYVPQKPLAEVSYIKSTGDAFAESGYHFFSADGISVTEPLRAVYIDVYGVYPDKDSTAVAQALYANNGFCDQTNAVGDNYNTALKGSDTGYEFFIRIPKGGMDKVFPLTFSVSNFPKETISEIIGWDDYGYPITETVGIYCDHITVVATTPSDDYDKYVKSLYQQMYQIDLEFPIFNQTVYVYSNIENGLGIFAGYASTEKKFDYYFDEEKDPTNPVIIG